MRISTITLGVCVVISGCAGVGLEPEAAEQATETSTAGDPPGVQMKSIGMEQQVGEPPMAEKTPKKLEIHGHTRIDDYYWLRDREDEKVVSYLEAENDYTEAVMKPTEGLQEELFEEMKGRLKQDDSSVPYRLDDFYYYSRYREGDEYPLYCRKQGSLEAEEEVILDVNKLAEGHEQVRVRGVRTSKDHSKLAFGIDTVGRRLYTLRFHDLETGEVLPDEIENVTGNYAWANDNKTIFYSKQDPETLRWDRIFKHVLGADPSKDELVYEEPDEEFSTFVFKTTSRRFLILGSEQTLSSEYRFLSADDPNGKFQVFLPREENHEYGIEDFGDDFYIRTNWNAKNFRMMKAPIPTESPSDKALWQDVIPHRDDVYLASWEIFRNYLVLSERKDALLHMRVIPWDGSEEHYLDFGEPAYLAYFDDNMTVDTDVLRYGYTSLTTPTSVFDYDMGTREKTLLKQDEVLGGFDRTNYVTERLWATARDGVRVPVSIVYRKGMKKDGKSPLLLYGYGSYGFSIDASFRSSRLSLIDRGFTFAIAHIRGGQELGRQWYEDGKLLEKKNTFTDFIDVGRFLAEAGYTSPDRLFAYGGSAGGLLMGAVANMAPDLFRGIVSAVPFVDVVTTMLDSDIPLTTSEYDEWGNPNEKQYYEYMLSYSPYDQLEAKDYPAMLVTTGLHDSQVQYWEPAKYVARLRALKTDDNPVLLKTNMEAGHSGASGRFKRYKETALDYAFLLSLAESSK